MTDKLVPRAELARQLGVSVSKINRYIKEGMIEPIGDDPPLFDIAICKSLIESADFSTAFNDPQLRLQHFRAEHEQAKVRKFKGELVDKRRAKIVADDLVKHCIGTIVDMPDKYTAYVVSITGMTQVQVRNMLVFLSRELADRVKEWDPSGFDADEDVDEDERLAELEDDDENSGWTLH